MFWRARVYLDYFPLVKGKLYKTFWKFLLRQTEALVKVSKSKPVLPHPFYAINCRGR